RGQRASRICPVRAEALRRSGSRADPSQRIPQQVSGGRGAMTLQPTSTDFLQAGAQRRAAADVIRRPGAPKSLRPRWSPWLFLLPYFLVTAVFFVYPLIYATILAFYQTNGAKSRAFVGLDNFLFVLHDADFLRALKNTTVFALCSICLQLPLSLGLAL